MTSDESGISAFRFHGKINLKFIGTELGDFYGDMLTSTNDKWIYENNNLVLMDDDILYYWIYVEHDDFGYRLDRQKYAKEGMSYLQMVESYINY